MKNLVVSFRQSPHMWARVETLTMDLRGFGNTHNNKLTNDV